MAQYESRNILRWNKLLHGIGIPLIFAGLILFLLTSGLGGRFFRGRLVFLFWTPD